MTAKKNDPFKEVIKAYLDKLASEDELFAKSYAKENKNLDECIKYIYEQVKKSGRCGFNDDEIYNLATHYYDEDDLGKISGVNGKVVVNYGIELTEEEKAAAKQRALAEYQAAERRKLEAASKPASTPKPKPESKPKAESKPKKENNTPDTSTPSLFDFAIEEDETEE